MLRLGIIGLGAVTRHIHLPAYSTLRDLVTVVGGCDIDAGAREAARNRLGIPAVFETADELIQATRPDIVSVCTPPALHCEGTLAALKAGCHVFCEKPLADSLEAADLMIDAARTADRAIVVNSEFPYMKIHLAAKKQIGSPEFGRLLFLQAWQTFHPNEDTEAGWRGGLTRRVGFEFGIHVFELIRFFFEATPVRLIASMPQPLGLAASDVINIVTVEFADGRAACVTLNRLSKGPERYLDMRLDGEFASIHTSIGGRLELTGGVHAKTRLPFVRFEFAKGGKAALQTGDRSRIIAKDGMNIFASATARHFANFAEAIRAGRKPAGSADDHRHTLALVFAAYESADSRAFVDVSEYLRPQFRSASRA